MSTPLVIERAELDGEEVSVRLEHGRVVAVGAPGGVDRRGAEVVDGHGGALLPGLHDHHLHLLALAARTMGVDVTDAADGTAFDRAIVEGAAAPASEGGPRWVRASGYDEHRHGRLDRARLDDLAARRTRPAALRVQHRSGLSWCLSSSALAAVGLVDGAPIPPAAAAGVELDAAGRPTGWLHRLDAWLGPRIGSAPPPLAPVGRHLASLGITGVTDTTPSIEPGALGLLRTAVVDGSLLQRLVVLGVHDPSDVAGWAAAGPLKLVADEQRGLDPPGLTSAVDGAHRRGRAVAIHCVTRAEAVVAVTALAEAGPRPGDRLEHGSVLPRELDAFLAASGVTVVVQPAWVLERGDHYLAEVDEDDLPVLHRAGSLLAAGVRVAAGSDAPFGSVDPWVAVGTAARRRSRRGVPVGPGEAVDPSVALGWFLGSGLDPGGSVRRVGPGAPGDLCLLDVPMDAVRHEPAAGHVRLTTIEGGVVHRG